MKITDYRVTPIAFRDPPLLNVQGVHQPWALRSIIELETDTGLVGLGESYGDKDVLEDLGKAREAVLGLDPFETNVLRQRLLNQVAPRSFQGMMLAPGTHGDKALEKTFAALEVAMLDLQGQILAKPVHEVLGGAVRQKVPYSAYLFYKFAHHKDNPYSPDPWGEVLTPEQMVGETQQMIDEYGFGSIKLKGGVFEPDLEIETMRQLHAAFPMYPLRIDPNGGWDVGTSIRAGRALEGTLEYLEDPTPTLEGMAAVAKNVSMPLATNMVVTSFAHLPEAIRLGAVQVILSDHHYWGGLRATQMLARHCQTFGLGLSMHSNSHLGISLAAMTHVAATIPNLTYACDTHYPWQEDEVIVGGKLKFDKGSLTISDKPGLGVALDDDALEKLHQNYVNCGVSERGDELEMKKYQSDWQAKLPRFVEKLIK
jgi:glucarate dehydratase